MIPLFLSLGSNSGDRYRHIADALSSLDIFLDRHYSSLSEILETKSWGFDSQDFLNCAVLYYVSLNGMGPEERALEILDSIKAIEREQGRIETMLYDNNGNRVYHDRTIDIDILYFGDYTINHPRLIIPHPLIEQRDFVKIPLSQISLHI